MRVNMASRRVVATGLAAAVVSGLVGCGGQGHTLVSASLADVPLAAGARVVWHQRRCDPGVSSYCSVEFVLSGPGYPSSAALRDAQRAVLKRSRWTSARGETNAERAAQSPHDNLRMTYATAFNDLLSIDEGTIERAPGVGRALARVLFSQTPALSGILQTGIS
jgi:hypothetical protein